MNAEIFIGDKACTARTEHRSQYVDLLILRIRAIVILARGNSEFKTLSMYQVHSFLIRRTELRVFSTYILRRVSVDGESSWDTQPSREPIMNRDPLAVLLWTS